ncbi:MAG: hypothetical protein ABI536_00645 [Gallionella sp.]
MTDSPNEKIENIKINNTQPGVGDAPEHAVYIYESAGISERKGNVPAWLWIVVVALVIWGIYYLVTYWNAPLTVI